MVLIFFVLSFSPWVTTVWAQDKKVEPSILFSKQSLETISLDNGLERRFHPLHEFSPNGPRLHILKGDPKKGPSLTLFRYSTNYTGSGRLHNHTHGYHLWLIEGAMKHWGENGNEKTAPLLVPGSYIYQPADEFHSANCLTERCTAYVMFDGPIETGFPDDNAPSEGN
ncbi:MAG: hypothetical protein AAF765_00325 [Bacteroidota bacterium]